MSEIPLNKFEKADLILKLLKEGRTYRDICHLAHVSPRDIKPISKKYEQQKRLENNKRKENNQEPTTKKLSTSSQAFLLFQEGKKPDDVKVLLDIPFKKARLFWIQYLKSIRMFESFEFYQDHSYDIPTFLSIDVFMKRNNIYGKNVVNVLRTASDIFHLNQTYSKLKEEIKNLELKRMSLLFYPNSSYSLQPLLPLNKPNYNCYPY